jgi:phage/plasmid-associated DNA primase
MSNESAASSNVSEENKESKMTWAALKNPSHIDMARCFTSQVVQEFVFSQGIWFYYNENNTITRLGKTHPDKLKTQVSDFLQKQVHELVKQLQIDDDHYSVYLKLAGGAHKIFGDSKWTNGVIDYIREQYSDHCFYSMIDTNMDLLAFSNGLLLDYGTKEIRTIQREDYIMKTTKNPLMQESSEGHRKFILAELLNIFNDPEVVRYWLETVAIALFRNSFEKMYCHTGSGGNGKGVLFGLVREALGDYYYQAPNEFLTTTYKADAPNSTLANSRGVRIFMTSEPSLESSDGRGMKLGTDLIKALTGRDPINARDLYESANRPFVPTFTVFLQCNTIPDFTSVDGGLRRRFEKMDYPNRFVEEPKRRNEKPIDYTLKEKLKEYAIVNEFILLLWDTAKAFTEFHRPASVSASTKLLLDDADRVLCWLEEKMEKVDVLPSENERITKAEALRMFMADTGVRMTPKKFHDQMKVNEIAIKKTGVEFYLLKRLPELE